MSLPSFVVKHGHSSDICLLPREARGCGGAVSLEGERATSLAQGRVDGLADTADRVSLILMSQWLVLSRDPQQKVTVMTEMPGSAGRPIRQFPVSCPSLLAGLQLAAWACSDSITGARVIKKPLLSPHGYRFMLPRTVPVTKRQAGRVGEKGRCLGEVLEWELRRQGHLVGRRGLGLLRR